MGEGKGEEREREVMISLSARERRPMFETNSWGARMRRASPRPSGVASRVVASVSLARTSWSGVSSVVSSLCNARLCHPSLLRYCLIVRPPLAIRYYLVGDKSVCKQGHPLLRVTPCNPE